MNKNDLSLVEYTQSEILKYISNNNCKLLPKEQELTELLGVSRVVVREALSRLRVLGFIGLASSCIIGWLSSFVFGYRKQTTQS